jgi:uncharacterized protein YaaN involved in tellurite resistance
MNNTQNIIPLKEDEGLNRQLERLNTDEMNRVNEIMETIKEDDPQNIIQYGMQAQTKISNFADTVISEYKNKDTGYVGEIVKELMIQVKNVNMDDLSQPKKKGFFAKSKSKMKNFVANFESVSSQIDNIIKDMEDARLTLMKDISMLDVLYDKNKSYIKELDMFIIAGGLKLQDLDQKVIPTMKHEVMVSDDLMEAQALQETIEYRNQFEKKLHDLKLTRQISIQALPQVRLISITNQELVNSIQSSIINTIPLWKNAVVNAVTLTRQKKALEMQKSVNDMTNELLLQNSRILKENTIGAATEVQRGIVDIETVKQVNADLIETIETVQKICNEGQEKRRLAELELVEMEKQLKHTILTH